MVDSGTLASLATHRADARSFLLFQFDSGDYGFHTGMGPEDFNSVTYVGAGGLIDVADIEEGQNGEVITMTFTMTSIPNSELTPDVLGSIEGEVYHLRPVYLYTRYYNPDTGAVLSTELEWAGEVDQISHIRSAEGPSILRVQCSSKDFEYQKIGYRMRDNADQKTISATDKSLKFAAVSGGERIRWGDKDPHKHGKGGGSGDGDKGKGKKKK